MDTEESLSTETSQIKAVIQQFLQERLQPKLDKTKEDDEEKRQALLEAHNLQTWVSNAASRVGQIQQVTHALKYIHPDAKGTNLSSPGNPHAGKMLVGTHLIHEQCEPDVVGNAAALDVYKFLRLQAGGKSLLSLAAGNDPALTAALSSDTRQAEEWMQGFAALTESKVSPATHKLAKQLYWPLETHNYHLLGPLFPSSLTHQVWITIRTDRFSDEAKAAREAHRKNEPHPQGYREYPNLAVQKFGGTKPQNISQLNSERHGENYLLPSLPPVWHSDPIKLPLFIDSVFDGWFDRRPQVRTTIRTLRDFLYSVQETTGNVRIRSKRQALLEQIIDQLLLFSTELQSQEEDWTLSRDCHLNIHEQCWLNPSRKETDPDFAAIYAFGEWQEAICKRFANWLNARLSNHKKPLPLGENEANEWQIMLGKEIKVLRREFDADE